MYGSLACRAPFMVISLLSAVACIGPLAPAATASGTWTNYFGVSPEPRVRGVYASGSNIYAGTYGGGVSVSSDSGTTWSSYSIANGLSSDHVLSVYASGGTIYAGTLGGLSASSDNGTSWITYNTNRNGYRPVLGVYASDSTIYAATWGGLSVSSDNGSTWSNYDASTGLAGNTFRSVYASGSTIYAGTDSGLSVYVVPTPGAIALLGAAGLVSTRRRRA
jgi:MYXO-CTERM domain-containing protein